MTGIDRRTPLPWTAVGYGLLCLYFVVALVLRNHLSSGDEGASLDLASCILQGRHLYSDLFHHHLPLPVYVGVCLTFLAGVSLPLVRLTVLFD